MPLEKGKVKPRWKLFSSGRSSMTPARIEELLDLFEQDAYASWSSVEAAQQKAVEDAKTSMKEAEDYLDSIMEAAAAEFRQFYDAAEKSSKEELPSLVHAADAAQKMGQSLGTAAAGASAAMKSKAHPS